MGARTVRPREVCNWGRRLVARSVPARTLIRCRRGVAAVEFALAATPLLMIVFGFIATNLLFFTLSVMQNSANYAAVMLATGSATTTNTGTLISCSAPPASGTAEYYACIGLPSWATFQAKSSRDCAALKASVTISVSASAAALADVFNIFTGETLSTTSISMPQGKGSCS